MSFSIDALSDQLERMVGPCIAIARTKSNGDVSNPSLNFFKMRVGIFSCVAGFPKHWSVSEVASAVLQVLQANMQVRCETPMRHVGPACMGALLKAVSGREYEVAKVADHAYKIHGQEFSFGPAFPILSAANFALLQLGFENLKSHRWVVAPSLKKSFPQEPEATPSQEPSHINALDLRSAIWELLGNFTVDVTESKDAGSFDLHMGVYQIIFTPDEANGVPEAAKSALRALNTCLPWTCHTPVVNVNGQMLSRFLHAVSGIDFHCKRVLGYTSTHFSFGENQDYRFDEKETLASAADAILRGHGFDHLFRDSWKPESFPQEPESTPSQPSKLDPYAGCALHDEAADNARKARDQLAAAKLAEARALLSAPVTPRFVDGASLGMGAWKSILGPVGTGKRRF